MSDIQPNPDLFKEFELWLKAQGRAPKSIMSDMWAIKSIPRNTNLESYFTDPDLGSKSLRIKAFRNYLRFLCKKKKIISKGELADLLDTFQPPKRRGTKPEGKAYPKSQWEGIIRKAPNKVAKMGIWLGFQFGLRVGEIVHLRIEDVDFAKKEILIRLQDKTEDQEEWRPKHSRERQIPFTKDQERILKRWINEERPRYLSHTYLLWTDQGVREGKGVLVTAFFNWCRKLGMKSHDLRRSFATHYYNKSKDVKLVSELLGHAKVSTTSDYLLLGKKNIMEKARKLFEES